MKVVIIEDERHTAEDLARIIKSAGPDIAVGAILASVKEAVAYFEAEGEPDLIFSDIQLGDGLSFSIFEQVCQHVPVVFCTAYDAYVMQAFQTMGLDYILKPIRDDSVCKAVNKFRALENRLGKTEAQPHHWHRILEKHMQPAAALLVYFKDKILPLSVKDIAVVYLKNEVTHVYGFDQKQYTLSDTLDEIGSKLGPAFFRVNRQHLTHRNAIKDVSRYFGRSLLVNLLVPFPHKITVGKLKVALFLEWLERA